METIPELFHRKGLIYLRRSRIADSRAKAYDWETSPYYEANKEEFGRLTGRYGEALRLGFRSPLEVREVSPEVGLGLFAGSDLEVGDLIGEYSGVVQESGDSPPDQKVDGHYLSDYAWNYPDELPDGTELEINALKEGNELRFANHSARPNMVVDHTLVDGVFVTFFWVTVPVAKGDQLTVDYGEEYWEGGFRDRRDL